MANCEVFDAEQHVYYRGKVVDIADDGNFIVFYENADSSFEGGEEEKVDWKLVREIPRSTVGRGGEIDAGSFVEVLCRVSEDEPFSWWIGTVKSRKGEYFHISFRGWDSGHDEVVERERIRPAMEINKNGDRIVPRHPPFQKKSYPVQQNLRSWLESEPAVLEKVRRDASLVSLSYRKGSIVGIGKKDKLESAALLLEIHLKHQMELERLRVEKQKLSAKLEEQRKKVESGFRVEFGIERSLIGLAVGKGGSNIKRVKQETGVDVIKINNDDEVIIIIGKDEQCVNEARMQLEFVSVEYDVPEGSAGALIGKKGENIKKITAKSKVERIKFRDSSSTKLEILGTRRACEDAKMIIDADLQFMREREALDRETGEIARELHRVSTGYNDHGRGEDGRKRPEGPRSAQVQQNGGSRVGKALPKRDQQPRSRRNNAGREGAVPMSSGSEQTQ